MTDVAVFGEDYAHEAFVVPLVRRVLGEQGLTVQILQRSSLQGGSRYLDELRRYLRDVEKGIEPRPDLVVAVTDANCKGLSKRRQDVMESLSSSVKDLVLCAIPDPHIERWMLLDSAAFKAAFGKGCKAPDKKCDRDRYKEALRVAVRQCDVDPALGGMEYAEDVVAALSLDLPKGKTKTCLGRFISDLRARAKFIVPPR